MTMNTYSAYNISTTLQLRNDSQLYDIVYVIDKQCNCYNTVIKNFVMNWHCTCSTIDIQEFNILKYTLK